MEIWSDVACPWCYIGKRRLEQALAKFPNANTVEVTWRAFELDPSAPREKQEGTYIERLAKKYNTSTREAQTMVDRLVDAARPDGLDFRFDIMCPGNTFDAHRLLHWALTERVQDILKERLFRAYFCEGQMLNDHDTLTRLASEVGLNPEAARAVLQSNAYGQEVREDEKEARSLGIGGVPFFVIADKFGVSGAQPPEILLDVLEKAQQSIALLVPDADPVADAVCGPETTVISETPR